MLTSVGRKTGLHLNVQVGVFYVYQKKVLI